MTGNIYNYTAQGVIPPHRVVAYTTNSDTRQLAATGVTYSAAGISTDAEAFGGERVDVQEDGAALLQVGAAVSPGAFLKAGADGKGVVAQNGDATIAQAKEAGTADEIIRVNITKTPKVAVGG